MNEILLIVQIIVAILLMVTVLLQQRGSGLGAGFGGSGDFYSTRRGIEKKLYWGTIILGFLLIVLALINLYIFK